MLWYDTIWYNIIWYDTIRYNIVIWYDIIWYDVTWPVSESGFEANKGSDGIARQNAQKKMHLQPTQDRTQTADDPSNVIYDILYFLSLMMKEFFMDQFWLSRACFFYFLLLCDGLESSQHLFVHNIKAFYIFGD